MFFNVNGAYSSESSSQNEDDEESSVEIPPTATFTLGKGGKKGKVNLTLRSDLKYLDVEVRKTFCVPRKRNFSIAVKNIFAARLENDPVEVEVDHRVHQEAFKEDDGRCNNRPLVIHYVKKDKKNVNKLLWKRLILNGSNLTRWKKAVSAAVTFAVKEIEQRPKRLLIFVNPYGGVGEARKVFKTEVGPLFCAAGIEFEMIETERANHALDLLKNDFDDDNLRRFDGVVCVGGDGIFNEVFNGVLQRSAENAGINLNKGDPVKPPDGLRLGVIPAGSTDAVALTLHGVIDVITSALNIVLGRRRSLDVAGIYTAAHNNNNSKPWRFERFSMTMASYGYFGDLLAHSEELRWVGPHRYDVSGAKTLLMNRRYEGVVKYVKDAEPETGDPVDLTPCGRGCSICSETTRRKNRSINHGHEEQREKVTKVVKGKFAVVSGCHMACKTTKCVKGVAPGAHLGDGHTDLIIVDGVSRLKYLRYMMRTGSKTKNPFTLPWVQVHRVREFSFAAKEGQVGGEDEERGGHDDEVEDELILDDEGRNDLDGGDGKFSSWNVDGEIVKTVNLRVKVHCQLIEVFGRGADFAHHVQDDDEEQPHDVDGECDTQRRHEDGVVKKTHTMNTFLSEEE